MRTHGLAKQTDGQSLLEFALALPLLLLLFMGASEFGRLCYIIIEVNNAAHAGATYGSQNRATAADTDGITTASDNEAADISPLQVVSQQLCAASYSDTPTTDCSGTPAVVYVQVNTQATVSSLFNSFSFGRRFTLHGQAIERVRS
jgi:Flp pilus assembly protein TadG